MSIFEWEMEKCAVSGNNVSVHICKSFSSFGSDNLDLRMHGISRLTMQYWVQTKTIRRYFYALNKTRKTLGCCKLYQLHKNHNFRIVTKKDDTVMQHL